MGSKWDIADFASDETGMVMSSHVQLIALVAIVGVVSLSALGTSYDHVIDEPGEGEPHALTGSRGLAGTGAAAGEGTHTDLGPSSWTDVQDVAGGSVRPDDSSGSPTSLAYGSQAGSRGSRGSRGDVTDGWARTAASRHQAVNPKLLHQGEGSPWTAQGFTHDAGRDEILTSYYSQDDDNDGKDIPGIRLSIQDRATGSEVEDVNLVGKDGTGGPLHGGGLATEGDYVYVTGGDTVWVYSREAIEEAPIGGDVKPLYEYEDVAASSYATVEDGRLYVGKYRNGEEGDLYSYELGADGQLLGLDGTPRAENPPEGPGFSDYFDGTGSGFEEARAWQAAYGARHEGATPSNIQGVEVVDGGFLFTQSHGADDPSDLYYQARGADPDDADKLGEMNALSQGFTIVGDEIYGVSESGSYQFREEYEDAFGESPTTTVDTYDLSDFGLEEHAGPTPTSAATATSTTTAAEVTAAEVTDGWAHTAADRHAAQEQETYDQYDLNRDGNVDPAEVELYNKHAELEAQGENPGPPIAFGGDEWIPQGQGYDQERDEILSTLNDYKKGGDNVRLTVQDRLTGTVARDVVLGGYTTKRAVAGRWVEDGVADAPNKGGGVATDGEFIYVADTQGVYVYRREDVDAAGDGETVPAVNFIPTEGSASFVTVDDEGHLYVGEFAEEGSERPQLYRYALDGQGGVSGEPLVNDAPYYAQGAAVTDDGIFYTTSFGSNLFSPHSLIYQPFEDKGGFEVGEARQVKKLPYYAEELNVIDGEIYITYESGSGEYKGDEGIQEIERISLEDLELDEDPSFFDRFFSKGQSLGRRGFNTAKEGFNKAKEFGGKVKDGIGDGIGKVKGLFS